MRKLMFVLGAAVMMAAFPGTGNAGAPHTFRHEISVLGMGGAYTAGGWRGSVIFYNPAAVATKGFHLNVPIRVGVGGVGGFSEIRDVYDFFEDNQNDLKSINQLPPDRVLELDQEAQKLDGKGGAFRVAPAFRLGWRGFAMQGYGSVVARPTMDTGVYMPRVNADAQFDVGVIAAYGARIRLFDRWTTRFVDKWYAGASIKVFRRYDAFTNFSFAEVVSSPNYMDAVEVDDGKTGVGIDVGTMVPVNKELTLALVAQDLVTFGDVTPTPSVNVGAHYKLWSRVHFVADYRDMFNEMDRPMPMHVHLGAEVDLTMLRLRGGLYQGYPTLGIGFNLWLIKIDAAYYTEELGDKLGHSPEDNIALEFQFGLD
jgi:hypothetical protein